MWITTNCGKFFRWWEYQATLPTFWEISMQVKKKQLEPNMEQWTGSKLGKKYDKDTYCNSAYLTYIQSISFEMLGWMNHKLKLRLLWEIPTISDMQLILLTTGSKEELKKPLSVEEEGKKTGLKLNIQKADHGIWSHHFTANRRGKSKTDRFYFLWLQNHCGWWLQPWN